jgi:hypothetical protein
LKKVEAGVAKRPTKSELKSGTIRSGANQSDKSAKNNLPLRMFLVPCSCGMTFAVAQNYDHQGTAWGRYLVCPGCGKRHDPKNRLLQMGFHAEGYWKVDDC